MADVLLNLVVFSMNNNPSFCMRALSPSTLLPEIICDCSSLYVGLSYCVPQFSAFVTFPVFASSMVGLDLESPLIVNESSAVAFQVPLIQPPFDPPRLHNFSLSFAYDTTTVGIPCVKSAFLLSGTSPYDRLPARRVVVSASLRQTIRVSVPAQVNPYVPTKLICYGLGGMPSWITVQCLNSDSLLLSGTVSQSGNFSFNVAAHEIYSRENVTAFSVSITAVDCGSSTCSNNGTCVDDTDPFNNIYVCKCLPGYGGPACSSTVVVVSSKSSSAVNTTAVAAALLTLAFIVGLACFLWVRRHQKQLQWRKYYHIFIR